MPGNGVLVLLVMSVAATASPISSSGKSTDSTFLVGVKMLLSIEWALIAVDEYFFRSTGIRLPSGLITAACSTVRVP